MPWTRPEKYYLNLVNKSPVYFKSMSSVITLYAKNLTTSFHLPGFSRDELARFHSFFDLLRHLLQSVNVNSVSECGESLLQWLCRFYQGSDLIHLVRYVCDHGANVNYCNPADGSSPLITLIVRSCGRLEGTIEIVTELIKRGADVNHKNIDGRNVFNILCFEPHFSLMKLLLDITEIDVNNVDEYGDDNLRYLLGKIGQKSTRNQVVGWEEVDLLLEKGFVVHAHLEELLWQVVSKKKDITKILSFTRLLIEKGVNVNHPNTFPMATYCHERNVLATLLQVQGAESKTDAEEECWRNIIISLLDAGLEINNQAVGTGITTLMNFCYFYKGNKFLELLRLLLERGADPDALGSASYCYIGRNYEKKFPQNKKVYLEGYCVFDTFLMNESQQHCLVEVYELLLWYGRKGPLTKTNRELQMRELLRAVGAL